jgi:hypothetical protein
MAALSGRFGVIMLALELATSGVVPELLAARRVRRGVRRLCRRQMTRTRREDRTTLRVAIPLVFAAA